MILIVKAGFYRLEESQIAHEILAYLADHADAQDTLEGIVQWWLLERKIKYDTKIVKAALNKLVREGQLEEIRDEIRNNNKINYRLKKKR